MNTHTDRCTRAQHRRGTASTHAWRDAPREIPPLMHLALESDGQAPCEVRFQPTHPNPTLNMRTTCTIECTCPNFFLFRVSLARTRLFFFFFSLSHCIFYKKLWEWGMTTAPQNAHGNSVRTPLQLSHNPRELSVTTAEGFFFSFNSAGSAFPNFGCRRQPKSH